MDLAKAFAASTAFEVPLSMGTIYVRPLTSHRIEALEELARSDGATDADVARETLRLAGRWNPDPDPHRWNKDDEEKADDIAAAATLADLEALARELVPKVAYLNKGPDNEGVALLRGEDETDLAFLRRALQTYRERQARYYARRQEERARDTRQMEEKRMRESLETTMAIQRRHMEDRDTILRGAEVLPRVEEQLEEVKWNSDQFNRRTIKIAIGGLAVAVLSLAVAAVAILKSYQDDPKIDGAIGALKALQEQSKAMSEELHGLREQLNPKTPPAAQPAPPPAKP